MSVLVKGFQMPTNCARCAFGAGWCRERIYMLKRPQRCPLIEVPEHGDLIDRDELMKHGVYIPLTGGNLPVVYISYVKAAKTVIPTERREG